MQLLKHNIKIIRILIILIKSLSVNNNWIFTVRKSLYKYFDYFLLNDIVKKIIFININIIRYSLLFQNVPPFFPHDVRMWALEYTTDSSIYLSPWSSGDYMYGNTDARVWKRLWHVWEIASNITLIIILNIW